MALNSSFPLLSQILDLQEWKRSKNDGKDC
jgi:hypothetical protein